MDIEVTVAIKEEWMYYALLYGKEAADEIMAEKRENMHQPRPRCPHCLTLAPYGDARIRWLQKHLDRRTHRWWWALRHKFQKG